MDALRILARYTSVAVYNVPIVYIEQALINHLPSGYKIDLTDITNDPKKSQEVQPYMFNKFICNIIGHQAGGRQIDCPYTLYTYIHCNRCDVTYYSYPTNKKA